MRCAARTIDAGVIPGKTASAVPAHRVVGRAGRAARDQRLGGTMCGRRSLSNSVGVDLRVSGRRGIPGRAASGPPQRSVDIACRADRQTGSQLDKLYFYIAVDADNGW
ncbi:hypothetical protein GCM10011588_29060 [Nocardia jinanensis]|uniref:Uncharacterized protein n=1 Tax=Nocardia jinanensis TaxID=382504 RepID=A0A917RLX7_9NOCA|nr:hypothetical protein GCM10011588_29060 [Nocardia jinanensis]